MRFWIIPALCLMLGLTHSTPITAQVMVPSHAVTILFPERRGSFTLTNRGPEPVVVNIDLANRGNVHQAKNDGLAIIYPRTARIEPGGKQKVSVTWRGDTTSSHYYLARVNTLEENLLRRDRSVENTAQDMQVNVGQAFPIHFEAPDTRPNIQISSKNGKAIITNQGQRGDHIQVLRLGNGQLVTFRQFITPGETVFAPTELTASQITSVKLRRFGWINIRGNK